MELRLLLQLIKTKSFSKFPNKLTAVEQEPTADVIIRSNL